MRRLFSTFARGAPAAGLFILRAAAGLALIVPSVVSLGAGALPTAVALHASAVVLGVLLLAGFWNKKLGVLGALGSVFTFITTITIIPFMPDGWAASAGGFPAMVGNVAFLMKDVVLLAVSIYLLKQDLARVTPSIELAR